MKHKIHFSGQVIDLDRSRADVEIGLSAALGRLYPQQFVQLASYTEVNDHTCEIEISRSYKENRGYELHGFLNWEYMSMISGLPLDCFDFTSKECILRQLTPWYDNMIYAPDAAFVSLWKRMNETLVKEHIRRVAIRPSVSSLTIRIIYPK